MQIGLNDVFLLWLSVAIKCIDNILIYYVYNDELASVTVGLRRGSFILQLKVFWSELPWF